MINLTKKEIKDHAATVADKTKPFAERKTAHEALMNRMLNPKQDFDPVTFDPMDGVDDYDIKRRARITPPPRLETSGLLPKEMFKGQMVGMFESKQDLYLTMAYFINDLLDRIEILEKGGQNKP